MRFATHGFAVWLLAAGLAGCANLGPDFETPTVHLADVSLQDATLFEQRFKLALRVQNPNPAELPIHGVSYDLRINGEAFARGASAERVTVPPWGSGLLQVEGHTTFVAILKQVAQLAAGGAAAPLRYRLTGKLGIAGLGAPIPFEQEGEIGLPGLHKRIPTPDGQGRQGAF